MTICLGAICDNKKQIILASDRMITVGFPFNIEFEPSIAKSEKVTEKCMVLTAGSALASTDLFRNVRTNLANISNPTVPQIVNEIKNEFIKQRLKRAEELHLKPLNLDFLTFYQNIKNLPPEFWMPIASKIERERYPLEILLCGIGTDGEAHIYTVLDPGIADCLDSIGFSAIGTGTPHALSTFTYYLYVPAFSREKSLYILYTAKKNAERAPGVGNQSNIWIINDSGIKELTQEQINKLDELYKSERRYDVINEEKIKSILEGR